MPLKIVGCILLTITLTCFTCACGPLWNGRTTGVRVKEGGLTASNATTLNFLGSDFDISCSGQNCDIATSASITKLGSLLDEGKMPPTAVLLNDIGHQNETGGEKVADYTGLDIRNTATSMTDSVTKTGVSIQSSGTWNGEDAVNRGLVVNVGGGDTNYAAIMNGGDVGIGTSTPKYKLHVADGAIAQEGPPGTKSYLRSNAANLASQSDLNPGLLFFDSLGFFFGTDLGYSDGSIRNRTRAFMPPNGDFAVSIAQPNATTQSNFADQLVVRGDSGRTGIGTITPVARLHTVEPEIGQDVFRAESLATTGNPDYRILHGSAATTGITSATLQRIELVPGRIYLIESRIVARQVDGNDQVGGAFIVRGTYRRVGDEAKLIGTVERRYSATKQPSWRVTLSTKGPDVIVKVTGSGHTPTTWQSTTIVQDVG